MRLKVTFLTLLATSWAGVAAAQVPIREIRLTLEPTTYSGPCPVRLRAHIVFVSNFPTRVDEDNWGWNFGRLAPHGWDVAGGHLRTSGRETAVDTTLTLPRAGDTGGLLHEGPVYVIMELNPTISNTVRYSVRCSPAVTIDPALVRPVAPGPTIALRTVPKLPPPSSGGAGPVVRLPDLVVSRLDPVAGVIAVTNTGEAPAASSELLLKILCVRDDGTTEACVGHAVLTDGGPPPGILYDRALGGQIHPVPALRAGETHTINVPSWSRLTWTPGKYEIAATADVRNHVVERSETNNARTVRFTKP